MFSKKEFDNTVHFTQFKPLGTSRDFVRFMRCSKYILCLGVFWQRIYQYVMQKPRVIPMNYAAFVVVGDLLKMTRKQVFM